MHVVRAGGVVGFAFDPDEFRFGFIGGGGKEKSRVGRIGRVGLCGVGWVGGWVLGAEEAVV